MKAGQAPEEDGQWLRWKSAKVLDLEREKVV